jgi:competence protein ComEC
MIMVLAFLWSLILGREKEVWNTLALAALCILAIDPHALFRISFQLSFMAVIGLLWLTPLLLKKVPFYKQNMRGERRLWHRMIGYLVGLMVVSVAATLFLFPVTSFYFHRVSLVTIPANISTVPLMGLWIIPAGLLSVVTLPFSTGLADALIQIGVWGLKAMIILVRFWSEIPWASMWVLTPTLIEMILFYAFLLVLFHPPQRRFAKVTAWSLLGILITINLTYWLLRVQFHSTLRVTYLDVGQANAALVEFPKGTKMLIDGGGFPRDHFDVGRMVVAPYLWLSKIRQIDILVLSHPQADHMNGLRFVARAFHSKEFWHNGLDVETPSFLELMDILETNAIPIYLPSDLKGGRKFGGATVELLYPPHSGISNLPSPQSADLNNQSLVLKISYAGKSFLFPGDLEREGEEALVSKAGPLLRSQVLLCPHHGSGTSSNEPFLRKVLPEVCVISCGENNFFGFPHGETLERLEAFGCRVLRIDRLGAVQVIVDKNGLKINTFKQPTTGPGS